MAVKRAKARMSCVDAAYLRIKNVFANGLPVYFSTSGGKDSICIADMLWKLILHGDIDPKQLTVIFIDEEAIYDCCIELVMMWRQRFLSVGAQFRWYCLPLKQVSCFNMLTNDESWITWEPGKEAVWVRQPPPFAIRSHPRLKKPGAMNYQTFLPLVTRDGIMITGVREAESVQRLQYMSALNLGMKGMTGNNMIYPVYDWKDSDVWKYIADNHVDIPEAYMWIYQAGENRHSLRISQFFACDSLRGLKHVAETDPGLWERIERREPNAYLVLLYWDSEWYKRNSRTRRKNEEADNKDYKTLCREMLFEHPDKYFTNKTTRTVARSYRSLYVKMDGIGRARDYRKMHDALVAGDPKLRSLRAIYQDVYGAYAEYAKQFRTKGGGSV